MPRHRLVVRLTHWVNAIGSLALLVSGIAILLAHPRLYWGETGSVDTDSLIDLPIPFVFGHSGWGRYLHFLAAWVCVLGGISYLVAGIATRHFSRDLIPSAADLSWSNLRATVADHLRFRVAGPSPTNAYNVLQRLAYATIVFIVGPLVLLSGLAFSPMLAARLPAIVTMFGGQQSARTVHFFAAAIVVVFLIVHVLMVALTGFTARMRTMITGGAAMPGEGS
jgi:thiosulfate reductase cytochrome b subunit